MELCLLYAAESTVGSGLFGVRSGEEGNDTGAAGRCPCSLSLFLFGCCFPTIDSPSFFTGSYCYVSCFFASASFCFSCAFHAHQRP